MAFEIDLMTGIAQLIAADGHGTWNRQGVYDPAQTGIFLRTAIERYPNAIVLGTYSISDAVTGGDAVVGLQVRCRKAGPDPAPVDDCDEGIFQLLHGLTHFTLSTGVVLVQVLRRSSGTLGQDVQDGLKRWNRTSNYEINSWHSSHNF